MAYPLDDYDKILLRHLQADASLSQQELGKIAHLSTAAVNRRLKLLQQAGVITHYSAAINPKAVGCDLTVIVEVMYDFQPFRSLAMFMPPELLPTTRLYQRTYFRPRFNDLDSFEP